MTILDSDRNKSLTRVFEDWKTFTVVVEIRSTLFGDYKRVNALMKPIIFCRASMLKYLVSQRAPKAFPTCLYSMTFFPFQIIIFDDTLIVLEILLFNLQIKSSTDALLSYLTSTVHLSEMDVATVSYKGKPRVKSV